MNEDDDIDSVASFHSNYSSGYYFDADEDAAIEDILGIKLHETLQIEANKFHCKPLGYFPMGRTTCNCIDDFYLPACLLRTLDEDILGFNYNNEFNKSTESVGLAGRVSCRKLRLKLYRQLWKGVCTIPEMYHSIRDEEGMNKRIRLPNCGCSIIRHLYPEQSGRYTGYKDKL